MSKTSLLKSFTIFNPTLSRGNEEKAMDNIIFFHPSTENNNAQMNRVGFCVACACICERFAVRNDHLELADEIQTDGAVTVLFSPRREVWVAVEVDPTVDTLSMRLILEKVVGNYTLLYGLDALHIEAPPHKRYVMGSDAAYEERLAESNMRKQNIEAFFSNFVNFLTNVALVPIVGANTPNYGFCARAAADALVALPTVIPSLDTAAFLRFDVLCSHFEPFLCATEAEIKQIFIDSKRAKLNLRFASSSSATTTAAAAAPNASVASDNSGGRAALESGVASSSSLLSSSTGGGGAAGGGVSPPPAPEFASSLFSMPPLQMVIGCADDCRLLYSSAPDAISHKLLFLVRTQLGFITARYKRRVMDLHYTDGNGRTVEQPILFAERGGYVLFILGAAVEKEKAIVPSSPAESGDGNGGGGGTVASPTPLYSLSYQLLASIMAQRYSLIADFLVCIELLAAEAFPKACEIRARTLSADFVKIRDSLATKNNNKNGTGKGSNKADGSGKASSSPPSSANNDWPNLLAVPLVASMNTATSATLFTPSPLSLLACISDGPVAYSAGSSTSAAAFSPNTNAPPRATNNSTSSSAAGNSVVGEPVPRCSETQPTVVGFNRGFVYGSPLASLPRMAQIAVAHYVSELWRHQYTTTAQSKGSAGSHTHSNMMGIATPPPPLSPLLHHEGDDEEPVDDETLHHFNQHYRHQLLHQINTLRFHGRVADATGASLKSAPALTLPTLLVDGEKDVCDVWIPIIVKPMGGGSTSGAPTASSAAANGATSSAALSASATQGSNGSGGGAAPAPGDSGDAYGIALLAIAQFNGRVVAIYFPPKNRQSFIEQMNTATQLFSAAFRGSGVI